MGMKRLWCLATDSGFFGKELETKRNKKIVEKVHETGLLDLTGSGRPRTYRRCVVQPGAVADWWYSCNGQHTCELVFKPKADILNICRDCQFVFSIFDELDGSFGMTVDLEAGVIAHNQCWGQPARHSPMHQWTNVVTAVTNVWGSTYCLLQKYRHWWRWCGGKGWRRQCAICLCGGSWWFWWQFSHST